MVPNPIIERIHPIIRTFLIPILFVSIGPMKLNAIIKRPPGKSTEAEMMAELYAIP